MARGRNRRCQKPQFQLDPSQLAGMDLDGDIKVDSQLFTEEEIQKMGGEVEDMNQIPSEVDVSLLPDPQEIATQVIQIMEKSLQPDLVELQKKQPAMYEKVMEASFPEFSKENYGLFQMVINLEEPSLLFQYLDHLTQVKAGKMTFQEASYAFADALDETFLYPNFSAQEVAEIKQKKQAKRQKPSSNA